MRTSAQELEFGLLPALEYKLCKLGILDPIYVFDNASTHESLAAQWAQRPVGEAYEGIATTLPFERFVIPPYSPEFNKVAEHAIGNTKKAVRTVVVKKGPESVSARDAQKILRREFKRTTTQDSVARDVASLLDTMRVIAASRGATVRVGRRMYAGTGGDWAPHELA